MQPQPASRSGNCVRAGLGRCDIHATRCLGLLLASDLMTRTVSDSAALNHLVRESCAGGDDRQCSWLCRSLHRVKVRSFDEPSLSRPDGPYGAVTDPVYWSVRPLSAR